MLDYRKILLMTIVILVSLTMTVAFVSASEWKPERLVTIVMWAPAGGAGDLSVRAMGASWQEQLGVPVNVVNMPGGSGGIAANYVWNKPRDGYTVLGMSEAVHGIAVVGGFQRSVEAFECMPIIGSPGVLSVGPKSPYKTFDELIDVAKTKTITAAASLASCVWALKLIQVQDATGVKFKRLPYEGSPPSQVAAMAGEVDCCLTAVAEQFDYLRAGKLKPLAIIEREGVDIKGVGYVPSISKWYPKFKDFPIIPQWVGLGLFADTPEEIKQTYLKAYEIGLKYEKVQALRKLGFKIGHEIFAPQDIKDLQKSFDSVFSWTLFDNGLAKYSPEKFGISRP